MAGIVRSVEEEAVISSDPLQWSLEDVIKNVCDPESNLRKTFICPSFPDGKLLEASFRDNDVSGMALLQDVDDKILKRDFGIKSMGQRSAFKRLVLHLRRRSTQWGEEEAYLVPSSGVGLVKQEFTFASSGWNTPRISRPSASPWVWPQSAFTLGGQSSFNNNHTDGSDQPLSYLNGGIPFTAPFPNAGRRVKNESEDADHALTNQLRTIPLNSFYGLNVAAHQSSGQQESNSSVPLSVQLQDAILPDQQISEKTSKQKKRIAPTNISSQYQSTLQTKMQHPMSPPTSPDEHHEPHIENNPKLDDPLPISQRPVEQLPPSFSDPVEPRPKDPVSPIDEQLGVVRVDAKGRKRLMPIPVESLRTNMLKREEGTNQPGVASFDMTEDTQSDNAANTSAESVQKHSRRSHLASNAYLGQRSLTVDNLFYGSTKIGQNIQIEEDDDMDEFCFVRSDISAPGRSSYVNSCMKHYLQTQPVAILGEGSELLGLQPYRERLIEAHQPVSLTVFDRDDDGNIITRRLDRAEFKLSGDGGFMVKVPGQDLQLSMTDGLADDHEFKSLEKWNYVPGHDDVLPIYGESDSEDECDDELMKEIEDDTESTGLTSAPRQKSTLANVDVDKILDTAITEFADEWKSRQEPKLERKAWRVWARAKRDGDRKARMLDTLNRIVTLNERLRKLRQEILHGRWMNEKSVMRQSKVLQPTVADKEFARWEHRVLQLQSPPKKPAPQPKKPLRNVDKSESAQQPSLNNALDLHDSNAELSSDDSMDDFVVDDDDDDSPAAIPVGGDACMADASGNNMDLPSPSIDENMCLSSGPDAPQSPDEPAGIRHDRKRDADAEQSKPATDLIDLTSPIDNSSGAVSWTADKHASEVSEEPTFKKPQLPTLSNKNMIVIDPTSSDFSDSQVPSIKAPISRPALNNYPAISKLDPLKLAEQCDRQRLLVYLVVKASKTLRSQIWETLAPETVDTAREKFLEALAQWKLYAERMHEMSHENSKSWMKLAVWLIGYTVPTVTTAEEGMHLEDVEATIEATGEGDHFHLFYDLLTRALRDTCLKSGSTSSTPSKDVRRSSQAKDGDENTSSQETVDASQSTKRKKILRTDTSAADKPRRRVYEVEESQAGLEKRQNARDRMKQEQERRREEITRQNKGLQSLVTKEKVRVNLTKAKDDAPVYLQSFRNGLSLRPHQIEGLQFLWREITADQDDLQGCLLAHTMGLGKTIQVIALLVALAQAGSSSDDCIQEQVPPSLRESRTIILCPPALVENWYDELLRWIPDSAAELIGAVVKVTSRLRPHDRLERIRHWAEEKGILLISYSLFRDLTLKTKDKEGKYLLAPEIVDEMRGILLGQASLVVADEAHHLKNENAGISKVVKGFKTTSRIALTGSPLANHLFEYFTLINWVAPEFLGTRAEFRATYEEPIREGLDRDARANQYRDALKRLKRLHLELEPKVLRADFDVLHTSLHGKREFMIKVPLTELQRKLYSLFVTEMSSTLSIKTNRMKILACLSQLQLLCHHPQLYLQRLRETGLTLTATKKSVKLSEKQEEGAAVTLDEVSLTELNIDDAAQSAMQSWITKSKAILESIPNLHEMVHSPKLTAALDLIDFSLGNEDKVLVFSHRPVVLSFLEKTLRARNSSLKSDRIFGDVVSFKRQQIAKDFNQGDVQILFVSTKAGGVGLNLYAANRIILLDEDFNPIHEQQAIGRAYRIGQQKPVYAYHIRVAGTYEDKLLDQGLFKTQLAARVVDHQSIKRNASIRPGEYVFQPLRCLPQSLADIRDKDPPVLDKLISYFDRNPLLSIVETETFLVKDETAKLTPEELKQTSEDLELDRNRRRDLKAGLANVQSSVVEFPNTLVDTWKTANAKEFPIAATQPDYSYTSVSLSRGQSAPATPTGESQFERKGTDEAVKPNSSQSDTEDTIAHTAKRKLNPTLQKTPWSTSAAGNEPSKATQRADMTGSNIAKNPVAHPTHPPTPTAGRTSSKGIRLPVSAAVGRQSTSKTVGTSPAVLPSLAPRPAASVTDTISPKISATPIHALSPRPTSPARSLAPRKSDSVASTSAPATQPTRIQSKPLMQPPLSQEQMPPAPHLSKTPLLGLADMKVAQSALTPTPASSQLPPTGPAAWRKQQAAKLSTPEPRDVSSTNPATGRITPSPNTPKFRRPAPLTGGRFVESPKVVEAFEKSIERSPSKAPSGTQIKQERSHHQVQRRDDSRGLKRSASASSHGERTERPAKRKIVRKEVCERVFRGGQMENMFHDILVTEEERTK